MRYIGTTRPLLCNRSWRLNRSTTPLQGARMFRSTLRIASLAIASAAASACGVKKTTTAINPAFSRAPTCDEAIIVYNSRADVPHDYYEVAWVQAEGSSVYT